MESYKPGGGNKPQPYIPAGNGEKSGEYVKESSSNINQNEYNKEKSNLVKKVDIIEKIAIHMSLSFYRKPNSVVIRYRYGKIVSERYYNEFGEAYLDIDYTNHNKPKTHTNPHMHRFTKNLDGSLKREDGEELIWE